MTDHGLKRRGEAVRRGSHALHFLLFLAMEPTTPRSSGEIMRHNGPADCVDQTNMRVHVFAIRKAFGDVRGLPQFIANALGCGYRFIGAVGLAASVGRPAKMVSRRACSGGPK